jgi:hypothetical protein
MPAAIDPQTQLATPTPGSLARTTSSTVAASNRGTVAPVSTEQRYQWRIASDLPVFTTTIVPAPTTYVEPTSTNSSPASQDAGAKTVGTPVLPAAVPVAAPLPRNAIAFTATLTPMKDAATPQQAPVSPNTTSNTPTFSSAAIVAAAASNDPTPAPAAQNVSSQPVTPATGEDLAGAQTGGNMQQGGDTPSQQQNGSAGTSARVTSPADTKAKPAVAKENDGIGEAPANRTTVADTPYASSPEQARTVVASRPEASATQTPFQSTAEALRTSESDLPATPQLRTGAAQEISIRIPQADSSTIDLRVVERAGQLHVDVRTSDGAMQTSLRQDLGTLTNSLERAGYHSETFTPSSMQARTMPGAPMSNQDDRQDQSQHRGGSGDFSGGRRQQQQQKRPSTWLEELEDQQ